MESDMSRTVLILFAISFVFGQTGKALLQWNMKVTTKIIND